MILINKESRTHKIIGSPLVGHKVESVEIDLDDVSRLLKMSDEEIRRTFEVMIMRFYPCQPVKTQEQLDDIYQCRHNALTQGDFTDQYMQAPRPID